MLSLIYVSSAVQPFSDDDLVALLQHAREKNTRLSVTGMLLYKDGNFMQALEGSEDVRKLFQTIADDDRHRQVIRLLERTIEHRQFPDWSMAFRNLNQPDLRDTPGYNEFLNQPLNSSGFHKNPDHAHRLLEVFRRGLV